MRAYKPSSTEAALDAELADQRSMLRELANGNIPLVVLDYLGNWLTPEMITLIARTSPRDGSARNL
ncbi:MAG: hypothetical protein U0074_01075 [Kouleothrix sp.]